MSERKLEVNVLRKRSLMFLEGSKHALSSGSYDLACFLAEQALQLHLKSLLLELVGDYPRTHSVRQLLGELNRVLNLHELEEFITTNRVRLLALEDAYLMSRYYVREYERGDAEDMVKLVEELISLLKRALGASR